MNDSKDWKLKWYGLPVSVPSMAPRTANAAEIGEYMITAR
jgi:hypothetical protein